MESSLKVCVLASGSKGNAVYISNGNTSILFDSGLSGIRIEQRLRSRGLDPEDLDCVIVSHEHSDHIQSAGVLSRRYNLPLYISSDTMSAASNNLGKIKQYINFESGKSFSVDSMKIHPFAISHDAADPTGFTVTQGKIKIGIATDLGVSTGLVKEHLKDSNLLIIESNHDPMMLEYGPYPWPLKQRIKSRLGHLSNEDSKNLINEIKHDELKYVILAHLSETNNTPEVALKTVAPALSDSSASLIAAAQDTCTELFSL